MALNASNVEAYMGAGLRVLIEGPAGTGKTAILRASAENLGWTIKEFNTALCDPFTDLTGIPSINKEEKSVDYYRPRAIDEADVIFFDEVNRAEDPKIHNAIFEIIQFGTINGEKLPKLKTVVAAQNPVSDEYATEELDLALLDRFDVYLKSAPTADYNFFKKKFGTRYARAGIKFFNAYQNDYNSAQRSKKNKMGYLSPRRLEKLMTAFQMFPRQTTIRDVLTDDIVVSAARVSEAFNEALGNTANDDTKKGTATKKKTAQSKTESRTQTERERVLSLGEENYTLKPTAQYVVNFYERAKKDKDTEAMAFIQEKVVKFAMRSGVGPVSLGRFSPVIADIARADKRRITDTMSSTKKTKMISSILELDPNF